MDGTLLDTEPLWDIAMVELAARHGVEMDAQLRASTLGNSSYDAISKVLIAAGIPEADWDIDADHAWSNARVHGLFGDGLPWRPGAQQTLDLLGEHDVPLALVTNTVRELTDVALKTLGGHRFTVTVCGDEVTAAKPAPEPYLRAAALLGVDPTNCVVIEDSPAGARAGHDAGAATLVVGEEALSGRIPPLARQTRRADLVGLTMADLSAALQASHAKMGTREDLR
ncbi:HAD family phosphatase [Gordonia sp. TBRC 11910]|uniref:HAD family phosphatase n=2 Tax=Gordonia asplenii TaxID=2725283 RepID=A0A848L361_9ACTN|nr:HAD family phosphatase [Gordonia asplenii]NMO05169.1 HAD family phosphatase [Gordonia asplenii]